MPRWGLAGMHQVYNAGVAIALAGLIKSSFSSVTPAVLGEGLRSVRWPGRLEMVMDTPPVIMDVAHNPAGCRALAQSLPHCVTVFSVSSDKDVSSMIDILVPISSPLILTQYSGERCLPLEQLQTHAGDRPHQSCPTLAQAIEEGCNSLQKTAPC
jgi:dihydrofolate synthase / folylpolyglutamate synthase